jgi:hypothetical protein
MAYSVVVFSKRRYSSQQVHGMVANSVLGNHATPIGHVGVVTKRDYSSVRDFQRQQSLRPRADSTFGLPCLLAVSGEAMYKKNAA